MSVFSDWDLGYCLTYEALNRKFNRIFYKQLSDKHLVKQAVAVAIAPAVGLSGGFTTHVVAGGSGYGATRLPTLEVSYFNEELQWEQQQGPTASYEPEVINGQLNAVKQKGALPKALFYPPGIEIVGGAGSGAVVLTGLQVGNEKALDVPQGTVKTVRQALSEWVCGETGIIHNLHKYFKQATLGGTVLGDAQKYLAGLPGDMPLSSVCSELLGYLLTNVWQEETFWMSSHLQTLLRAQNQKAFLSQAELQALYVYAVRLPDPSGKKTPPVSAKEALEEIKKTSSGPTEPMLREIGEKYSSFSESEVENLKQEAAFRAREALFKVEFDFVAGTLTQWPLSRSLVLAEPQVLAQALLEVFACLVPTLLPDLLFDVTGVGAAAAAFAVRLGPWRIETDKILSGDKKFKLRIPVLGGMYYTGGSGAKLQVFNERYDRAWTVVYETLFVAAAHQNPGYATRDIYVGIPVFTEGEATKPVTTFQKNPSVAVLDNPAVLLAALTNSSVAPVHPAGYAALFQYSYTNLFSSLHVLDDLPKLDAIGSAAKLDWARVLKYEFVFRQIDEDTGQLYIFGNTTLKGLSTLPPLLTGGDLNQLPGDSDARLHVSLKLLMQNIFLPNLANMFQVAKNGSYPVALPEDFSYFSRVVQNKNEVYIKYSDLRGALKESLGDEAEQLCKNMLALDDNDLFTIPAGSFTFAAKDDLLEINFASLYYKEKVVLTKLQISFRYSFQKQNGSQRYNLTSITKLDNLDFKDTGIVKFLDDYSFVLIPTGSLLVAILSGGVHWWWSGRKIKLMMPALPSNKDEWEPLLAFLNKLPLSKIAQRVPRPDLDSSNQNLVRPNTNSVFPKNAAKNSFTKSIVHKSVSFLQQQEVSLQQADYESRERPVVLVVARNVNEEPPAHQESGQSKANQLLLEKYSRLVGKHVVSGFFERFRFTSLYWKPIPLILDKQLESSLLGHTHEYGLRLVGATHKDNGSATLNVQLTDKVRHTNSRDARQLDAVTRAVELRYSYEKDDISTLKFDKLVPLEPEDKKNKWLHDALHTTHFDTDSEVGKYGEIMQPKLTDAFVRIIREKVLEATFSREEATPEANRGRRNAFWSGVGGVAAGALVGGANLFTVRMLSAHRANSLAPIKTLLGDGFVSTFLNKKLNAVKFPYEEHFDINQLVIDSEGLKVDMGPLTSSTLVFKDKEALEQAVCTYINVRSLAEIVLSVADLQDLNSMPDSQTLAFTIGFGVKNPLSDNKPENPAYTLVGTQVAFRLSGDTTKGSPAFALHYGTAQPATTITLALAAFGSIAEASVLVVKREKKDFLPKQGFSPKEENYLNVYFGG